MRFKYGRRACGLLVLALLAACGASEPEMAQAPPVVAVMPATPVDLALTDDLPGRVTALRVAEIRPQVSGIVLRRLFEQGADIKQGQALFEINPAPFRAERDMAAAALQRAEAALTRARTQVNRMAPLVKADAVSQQVYDDAVSQRDQAAADVTQARATLARRELDLKFATIDAPISGRIDQALITEGALVSSSDSNPLARIQQIDQVYVDVRQPASSLEALRATLAGQTGAAGLPVQILRSDGSVYAESGRMLFSGINVDAGTGDVLLRVLVDNPQQRLLPGMFVRARVPQASYRDAITVPQQAVVRAGGKTLVWTLDTQGQAHMTPVELGELLDRRYRIRSGLSAGQKVVVEGMERLSDGVAVAARDWQPAVAGR